MLIPNGARHVATLWQLWFADSQLSCIVYDTGDGMRLSLQTSTAEILAERFEIQPRALARATALRLLLGRRGWSERQSS